jgi:hypothetical protein
MKLNRSDVIGLAMISWLSGCAETETAISVNVRYWTNYLNPQSFKVKIEKEGEAPIEEGLVPQDLGGGKFDVVCDHNWEVEYCRFYQRFPVPSWSDGDLTVTLSGTTQDGTDLASVIVANEIGDKLSDTIEMKANEVNVVYIELPNVKPAPPPMDETSDTGTSSSDGTTNGGTASTDDETSTEETSVGTTTASSGGTDESVDTSSVETTADESSTGDEGDG